MITLLITCYLTGGFIVASLASKFDPSRDPAGVWSDNAVAVLFVFAVLAWPVVVLVYSFLFILRAVKAWLKFIGGAK